MNEITVLSIEFPQWYKVCITANLVAFIVGVFLVLFLKWVIPKLLKKGIGRTVIIDQATIGIGSSSITLKRDKQIQQIAHKIWVELQTRKIGLEIDENHDVLVEIYDSWYAAFTAIRNLLTEIPVDRINQSKELTELTIKVLNEGLRPHLTIWQAQFRLWYGEALKTEENKNRTPQEIQKQYPHFQELINNIKEANHIASAFAEELHKVAYDS